MATNDPQLKARDVIATLLDEFMRRTLAEHDRMPTAPEIVDFLRSDEILDRFRFCPWCEES
jgi:hypothetical protein